MCQCYQLCSENAYLQKKLNNWLAVQNLRIALKKAVFALGFKKSSVITLSMQKVSDVPG